jgi:hypothetical protein
MRSESGNFPLQLSIFPALRRQSFQSESLKQAYGWRCRQLATTSDSILWFAEVSKAEGHSCRPGCQQKYSVVEIEENAALHGLQMAT